MKDDVHAITVIGHTWSLMQRFRGWRVDESTWPYVARPTQATFASFGKLNLPVWLRFG